MKTIVFVISSYGFGHLTRQLALIHALLEKNQELRIRLVCSNLHLKILNLQVLSKKIELFEIPFVPILTMDNPAKVDIKSTIYSYQLSMDFDTQVRDDMAWGRILHGTDLIINDIESVHNEIAKKMAIPIVNISNFTWCDILMGLGAEELANDYVKQVNLANYHLKLPFSSKCLGFDNPVSIGLLTREINQSFIESIKINYPDKQFIFLNNLGANILKNFEYLIEELHSRNFIPIFHQDLVSKLNNPRQLLTYNSKSSDTHNLIALSDIIVGKMGYSTLAECYTGGTHFIYWMREQYSEDEDLSQSVMKDGYGTAINYSIEITELISTIDKVMNNLKHSQLIPRDNDTKNIANYIIDNFLKL